MSESAQTNEVALVREKALSLLARREYPVLELQRKLEQKYPAELVRDVTESLVRENLLSDQRFAEAYTRSRTTRGFGPVRIAMELKERGVSRELSQQALNFDDQFWVENLSRLHQKKYNGVQPGDLKNRQKQVSFFSYRGFTHEQIKQVLSHQ